jgi:hypothetical protein
MIKQQERQPCPFHDEAFGYMEEIPSALIILIYQAQNIQFRPH